MKRPPVLRRPVRAASFFFVAAVSLLFFEAFYPSRLLGEFFYDEYGSAKQIDVVMGESKVVPVANPKRIAIGDPKIADVVGAGATEVILAAKGVGETNLQIWDDMGQREIAVRVFQEDLKKLQGRLEDLFKTAGIRGIRFQAGEQERKVFVLGEVPARKKDVVTQLLLSFQDKIVNLVTFSDESPVVEIDVQVLEISKKLLDHLGFSWSTALAFAEAGAEASHTLSRHWGDVIKSPYQMQFTRSPIDLTINMLEQDNMLRVLARPKLVALSGSEAKILVGGEVPVVSGLSSSEGIATTTVEYKEYGIKLSIKPTVTEAGDINCLLEVEIRTIDTSNQLSVQTGAAVSTTTPAFKVRNVNSEMFLKNKETVFMAGLIDSMEVNNIQTVPGIGNLPIIGALFRSRDFQTGATELVVSLTPKIVRYGDMRDKLPAGADISKKDLEDDPAEAYSRAVQQAILKNVGYPMEAQRANLSGEVVLSLHLLSSGQLVNAVVSQSSGHKILDNAAIFSVKRLSPYPAFPNELMLKEIWVEVPITYQTS